MRIKSKFDDALKHVMHFTSFACSRERGSITLLSVVHCWRTVVHPITDDNDDDEAIVLLAMIVGHTIMMMSTKRYAALETHLYTCTRITN